MARPLWQLLLSEQPPDGGKPFTCEECFIALEYYADRILAGAEVAEINRYVLHHLAHCPDCRETFVKQLDQIREISNHENK